MYGVMRVKGVACVHAFCSTRVRASVGFVLGRVSGLSALYWGLRS